MDDDQHREALGRFQGIYEAHYRSVTAYARRRISDPVDAQDVVAETFTIAWRRLDELPDDEAVLPWLYGVARRVLANQRRGNRRRADLTTKLRSQHGGSADVESEVLAAEERRTVLAALSRLRAADQEILRLAVWEELPHREIAQVVGGSESSVAVRLHRARSRLGREIGKEERRRGHEDPGHPGRRAEGHEK
ncbi:MAG TPA: sigma-70 family RNA polymerase sigma factor [Acidimicrobiales bacterium]|nr:sigma-70 family RNA polymerase sigma factor [Acidimicrobiales bacterium]